MDIYIKLFEVIFPVFFVVGIGYYLGKKNPKIDTSFITNFGANIGSPAIVFYSVVTTGLSLEVFKSYFIYYLLAIICFSDIECGDQTAIGEFIRPEDIVRMAEESGLTLTSDYYYSRIDRFVHSCNLGVASFVFTKE